MITSFIHRLKPAHMTLIRAIHDTGKLQLAADDAGMSQPAASRLLADIETDVGGALFERLPRGMAPTPLGEAVVRHIRVILSEIEFLAEDIVKMQGGQAGKVSVGSVTGPAVSALLPALVAIRQDSPDFQPNIEVAPSVTLLRGLEEGHFDFVLARVGPGADTRKLLAHPGRTERVCFLVGADHPLAGRKVPLAETLEYDFVTQELGSPIRAAVEQSFLESGLPTPQRNINSSSLLVALTLINISTAIAPQTHEVAQVLSRNNPAFGIIDIEEDIIVSPFLILQVRGRSLTRIAERLLHETLQRL